MRLLDSIRVPCGTSCETAKRSDMAGHACYGYCVSHSRFFWGLRLYLISAPDGMPVIWVLSNVKISEREATQALLEADHRPVHEGQVILSDEGFAGRDFEELITNDLGALGPARS